MKKDGVKLLKFLGIFSIILITSLLIFQYDTITGNVIFKTNILKAKTNIVNVDDFADNIVKKTFSSVCDSNHGSNYSCFDGKIMYQKLNRYIIVQGDPCKTELIGSTNCKLAPFKDVAGKSGFYIFSIKGSKLKDLVGPEAQMWEQIKPGMQTTTYTTTGHVAKDKGKKKCANNEDKTPNVAKNKGAISLKPTPRDMAIAVINTRGTGKYSEGEQELKDFDSGSTEVKPVENKGAATSVGMAVIRSVMNFLGSSSTSNNKPSGGSSDSLIRKDTLGSFNSGGNKLCDQECSTGSSTGPVYVLPWGHVKVNPNAVINPNNKPKLIDITAVSQPGLDGDRKGPLIIPNLRKDGATDNREPGNSNLIGGPCSKGMLPTLGETFARQVTIKIISDTDPFLRDIPVSS